MIPEILRIPKQIENSKTEDLNETTMYNQFHLKDEIETNQTYIIEIRTIKTILSPETKMKFHKKQLR